MDFFNVLEKLPGGPKTKALTVFTGAALPYAATYSALGLPKPAMGLSIALLGWFSKWVYDVSKGMRLSQELGANKPFRPESDKGGLELLFNHPWKSSIAAAASVAGVGYLGGEENIENLANTFAHFSVILRGGLLALDDVRPSRKEQSASNHKILQSKGKGVEYHLLPPAHTNIVRAYRLTDNSTKLEVIRRARGIYPVSKSQWYIANGKSVDRFDQALGFLAVNDSKGVDAILKDPFDRTMFKVLLDDPSGIPELFNKYGLPSSKIEGHEVYFYPGEPRLIFKRGDLQAERKFGLELEKRYSKVADKPMFRLVGPPVVYEEWGAMVMEGGLSMPAYFQKTQNFNKLYDAARFLAILHSIGDQTDAIPDLEASLRKRSKGCDALERTVDSILPLMDIVRGPIGWSYDAHQYQFIVGHCLTKLDNELRGMEPFAYDVAKLIEQGYCLPFDEAGDDIRGGVIGTYINELNNKGFDLDTEEFGASVMASIPIKAVSLLGYSRESGAKNIDHILRSGIHACELLSDSGFVDTTSPLANLSTLLGEYRAGHINPI